MGLHDAPAMNKQRRLQQERMMRSLPQRHSFPTLFAAALLMTATTPTYAVPSPNDTMAFLKKAYSQIGSGNFDTAINTLCVAIRNDRNSVMARRYLCYALLQRGDARQAISQLDALAQLNQGIPFDLCMRGQALQMIGEFDKATEAYKAAMGMDPKNDYVREKLIDALQNSGKYQEASAICADGYYGTADRKMKDHYLESFNQIQTARAYLHEKSGGAEWTTTGPAPTPATASTDTIYGSNPSSFKTSSPEAPPVPPGQ
jgi:tetratricopeptide (TPR) repeat protein